MYVYIYIYIYVYVLVLMEADLRGAAVLAGTASRTFDRTRSDRMALCCAARHAMRRATCCIAENYEYLLCAGLTNT